MGPRERPASPRRRAGEFAHPGCGTAGRRRRRAADHGLEPRPRSPAVRSRSPPSSYEHAPTTRLPHLVDALDHLEAVLEAIDAYREATIEPGPDDEIVITELVGDAEAAVGAALRGVFGS